MSSVFFPFRGTMERNKKTRRIMEQIGIDPEEYEKFNNMSLEERKKWVEEETEKRLKLHRKISQINLNKN